MKMNDLFKFLIVACFLINHFLLSQEPEQLKQQDVSKIMEQIFAEHLGQKTIDDEILLEHHSSTFDRSSFEQLKNFCKTYY